MVVEEEEANWLDLPKHLLELIIDKLNINFFDYTRFGAVCVSWRSVFLDHTPKQFPPFLLIPTPYNEDESTTKEKLNKKKHKTKSRSFYSISDNKVCDQYCQVRMPRYRQCRGSSHDGWLITVDDLRTSYSIRLFNPFLSHEILLPSLETFPKPSPLYNIHNYTHLKKAVLSADPLSNPDDYTILAIYEPHSSLAFYKPGDKAWSPILHCKPDDIENWYNLINPGGFHDITCYKGRFHAILYDGTVVVCDPEKRTATIAFSGPEEEVAGPKKYYLVRTSNKVLMQVVRSFEVDDTKMNGRKYTRSTTGFQVFKLGNDNKWEPVKSLGEYALFIGGENDCISISTSDYPGSLIKPNCIYYIYEDEPSHCPNDMGVYHLEDGSFEKHYHLPDLSSIYPVPIWIQPSLQKKQQ